MRSSAYDNDGRTTHSTPIAAGSDLGRLARLRRRPLLLGLLALLLAAAAFWILTGPVAEDGAEEGPMASGLPPPGTVFRRTLSQRVTVSGTIMPKKRQDVKPPYNGYVSKIYVKIGERVKAGDPIVTFSPSLAREEANFPIRAAFAGVVAQVLRTEGEYVGETGDQNLVARIEDASELSVQAMVPELDVAKTKVGQEAMVRVSALPMETYRGVIREIALSARDKERWSSSSAEFGMRVALLDRDPQLLPGMSALMDVITAKRENVLALGHEFIQEGSGGPFVTLENGQTRPVKLGLQTDEASEILEGLEEGERARPIDFLSLPKQAE